MKFNVTDSFQTLKQQLLKPFQPDIREALLNSIDCRLMLFDGHLINLENGRKILLDDREPASLAAAAKEITANDARQLALFLPASHFVQTAVELPGVDANDIEALLNYQQQELLPAYDGRLQLAVNPQRHDPGQHIFALWMDEKFTAECYDSFNQAGFTLMMLAPSIFSLYRYHVEPRWYIEQNEQYCLAMQLQAGQLISWEVMFMADFKLPGITERWQALNAAAEQANSQQLCQPLAQQYPPLEALAGFPYAFFPLQARSQNQRKSRLKTGKIGSMLVVLAVITAVFPFIANAVRISQEQAKYAEVMALSRDVREMKSYILNSEEEWATYQQFPIIHMARLIESLDQLIPKNSWLMSLSYEQGKVEIKGNSADPAGLLQILSQHPEYTNAAFSQNTRIDRGKQNEYFGITFDIKNLPYEAYKAEYFPDLMVLD